ncbi:mitochondrial ATP synthase g subunit-domain-containing protein [Schizothecium vesticola]|uniref:Mitochondrial ATP synthase g subunit-domain-containing protein n=1 Tax=Schizothecium vesticola TaxID=314040 RepID=A0AA40K9Z0_9PEZI|nr:mitochondrial ATP synthase g subunit-domain-containing protein [Schizothecium vesticola]
MSFALVSRRAGLGLGRRMVRFESTSTTTKAAETAKNAASRASATASEYTAKASEYTAKASEGLSRVTAAAGPAITSAAKGAADALGKVGGRTGRLVTFIERQVPNVVYYSKVGAELSKLVFKGQHMTPPPMTTVQSYWNNLLKQVQNPSTLLQSVQKTASSSGSALPNLRNISTAQVVAGGVVAAECLGFFTVGEMIGRFKLIGYHGQTGAAHH